MRHERDDERLREEFQRLRAETGRSGGVPDFPSMMAKARAAAAPAHLDVVDGGARPAVLRVGERGRGRRALLLGGWAGAAVAAAVAGLLLIDRGHDADDEFARLVASYSADLRAGPLRSPTDVLLEVPGMSLIRSMPSIGTPLRGLDTTTRPSARDGRGS